MITFIQAYRGYEMLQSIDDRRISLSVSIFLYKSLRTGKKSIHMCQGYASANLRWSPRVLARAGKIDIYFICKKIGNKGKS